MVHILQRNIPLMGIRWLVCFSFLGILSATVFAQSSNVDEDKESALAKTGGADELIRLESTFVGDKEQPSVSYFIRWKGTDSPDRLRWDIKRKNDDTLDLVDRDIMLRSMNIYNEMRLEQ